MTTKMTGGRAGDVLVTGNELWRSTVQHVDYDLKIAERANFKCSYRKTR